MALFILLGSSGNVVIEGLQWVKRLACGGELPAAESLGGRLRFPRVVLFYFERAANVVTVGVVAVRC